MNNDPSSADEVTTTAVGPWRATACTPRRIACGYTVVSLAWIIGSDRLLESLFTDPSLLTMAQTVKGWFFVLSTGLILYMILRIQRRHLDLRERSLRQIIARHPQPMAYVDGNGRFVYINRRFEQMLGYHLEDLPDLATWWRQALPDLASRREIERHLDSGKAPAHVPLDLDKPAPCHRIRARNGHERMVELSTVGTDGGVVVALKDITTAKQRERVLADREQALRTILDSIADAVIATDAQGMVQRLNAVAERLIGTTSDAAIGRPVAAVLEIYDPVDRQPLLAEVIATVADGEIVRERSGHLHQQGGERLVTLSAGPIHFDGEDEDSSDPVMEQGDASTAHAVNPARSVAGRVNGMVLAFRDTTDQALLEDQLRHSQKMEAVGQLAGGIAHDFNNMLAGILGFGELLSQHLQGDQRGLDYLRWINQSAQRAADLTSKLLVFARKDRPASTPVDVHDLIHEAVAILRPSIDPRISIDVDLRAPNAVVVGDPGPLQNCLFNLCLNARDAMPDGGTIRIVTDQRHLDTDSAPITAFAELDPDTYLEITVADTGQGMPAAVLQRAFDPFFTTKAIGTGTGLGLAAVYGTVTAHRGAIHADSAPGRGTTFTILFPLAQTPIVATDETQDEDPLPGHGHILVVEDEEVIRSMTREMLSDLGYEVSEATDGQAAVACYQRAHDHIDLVLLDMVMPRMNGRDCYYALKEIDPAVRVVVATGFAEDGDLLDLRRAGVQAVVRKPYQWVDLSRILARVLGKTESTA